MYCTCELRCDLDCHLCVDIRLAKQNSEMRNCKQKILEICKHG